MVRRLDKREKNILSRSYRPEAHTQQEIAKHNIGGHSCLDLDGISRQSLGGPTNADDGSQCTLPTAVEFTVHAAHWRSHMATNTDLVRRKPEA